MLRRRPELKKKERRLLDKPPEPKKKLLKPPESLLRPKERSLLPWKPNKRLTKKSRDLRKREEPRLWPRRRLPRKPLKLRRKKERDLPKRRQDRPPSKLLNKRELPRRLIRERRRWRSSSKRKDKQTKWLKPKKPERSKLQESPRRRPRKPSLLPRALNNKRPPKLNKLELRPLWRKPRKKKQSFKLIRQLRSKSLPTPRRRPKWLEKLRFRPKLIKLLLKRPLLLPRRKPKLLRLKPPVKWPPLKS